MEPSIIVTSVISALSGGAAWNFYTKYFQSKREDSNLFRDQMLERFKRLETELAVANERVVDLTAEVHALRVKVDFLTKENDILKAR